MPECRLGAQKSWYLKGVLASNFSAEDIYLICPGEPVGYACGKKSDECRERGREEETVEEMMRGRYRKAQLKHKVIKQLRESVSPLAKEGCQWVRAERGELR